jgi:hypothetical protein
MLITKVWCIPLAIGVNISRLTDVVPKTAVDSTKL